MEYLRHVRRVVVLHWMPGAPSLWNRSIDLAGLSGTQLREAFSVPLSCFIKRSMDLVLALVIGIVTLPLIAVIACLIRFSSPGPVFFCHRRIGRGGRVFPMWKFRSMVLDADAALDSYLDADPELRTEWERDHKLRLDPRVTAVGRWLRRTSLDELPQLWNVIRGEMSLVGPRPIVSSAEGSAYVQQYPESFEIYRRVRPGMTGLWQISGRNNTTYARRVQLDRYYVLNWSPWVDLFILCRTPKVVITGERRRVLRE
jgi:Undecaprenyl-phosphate galactose phosphotransferase WbaP